MDRPILILASGNIPDKSIKMSGSEPPPGRKGRRLVPPHRALSDNDPRLSRTILTALPPAAIVQCRPDGRKPAATGRSRASGRGTRAIHQNAQKCIKRHSAMFGEGRSPLDFILSHGSSSGGPEAEWQRAARCRFQSHDRSF
jgi:hypothetical protein